MPDTRVCDEIKKRLASSESETISLSMSEIEKRLGLDQQRLPADDPHSQNSPLMELWERRQERRERDKQVNALLEDHEQKTTQREELYEKQQREAQIKQRDLDLRAQRIRLAQQGGYSGLTADEARAALLRIAMQKQEIEVERARAEVSLSRQAVASLDEIIPQIEVLKEEMQQLDKEIAGKSQGQLERERDRACRWFGRWA